MQLPFGGVSPLLTSLDVLSTRRPRRRAGGEHDDEEQPDFREGLDEHGQEALIRFAHHHPGELCRRMLVRMAQGMGQRGVAAESGSARPPAVALVYTTSVLIPALLQTMAVSYRYKREIATLATAIDQLARGESSTAADTLAQRLKALETAVRDGGAWEAARWVEVVPGETTLVEGFEAETQRREQTRSARVASYRDKLKEKKKTKRTAE